MCFDVLYYPENDITKNSTERKTANERAEFQPPATKSIGILRGGKTESERNIPQSANERQPEKKKHTHEFNEEKIVRETRRTKKISSRKKRMKYRNNNNKWAGIEFCFCFCFVSFCSVLDTMTNAFWFRKLHDYFAELITLFIRIARQEMRERESGTERKKTKDWY